MSRIASTLEAGNHIYAQTDKNRRGLNVYTLSEIVNVSGSDKQGNIKTVETQIPVFILTPMEREWLVRMNSYLFGIVTSRMNRISSLEWKVTRKKEEEELIVEKMKAFYQIWVENDNLSDIRQLVIRRKAVMSIQEEIKDMKDDLSNFDSALKRWRRNLKNQNQYSASQIEDWVNSINSEDDFEEFQKKWVFDLMVHGAEAIYKQFIDGVIENAYLLPGGSVYPIRSRYVGSSTGYIQMLHGYEPKIYFSDEMIFDSYVPVSARSHGLIPIEALINKVTESLLFDKLAAERADGTKPPEKLIILGEQSKMFGDLNSVSFNIPANQEEQKRIETIVNEERKNAIRVISGVGQPVVSDISKADTFSEQSERQTRLIRDIGFVFNMSPFEMSLAGSDYVAGRETASEQAKQEKERGIYPIVRIIDKTMTSKIIPYKFGSGWILEHNTGMSEVEQIKLDAQKLSSGTYAVNEIREDRGDDPYPEENYERPPGQQTENQQPGFNDINPFFTKEVR